MFGIRSASTMPAAFAACLETLLLLAGCAAGGGGGGTGARTATPVPLVYPTITSGASLNGQSVHMGIDKATLRGTELNGTVDGTITFVGDRPTRIAMDFSVPAASLQFSETFDSMIVQTLQIAPGMQVSLSSEQKVASDGSTRAILLLHPDSAGLRYSTLGAWSYEAPAATTEYDGRYVLGTVTRVRDIPVTGSASYTGLMLGTLVDGSAVYNVSSRASAQADFGARSIAFATDQSMRALRGGGVLTPDSSLDLVGTLTYPAASNRIAGTLTTASGEMSGSATARFYGPAVHELGGIYFIEKADRSKQMSGAFALKR
jgi:hypothetical protein